MHIVLGYAFSPGSALLLHVQDTGRVAARAATNTALASAAGACTALMANMLLQECRTGEFKFDLRAAMNGALSGLVAATGSCGTLENWASCLVGAVAGLLYIAGSAALLKFHLDDAVDAIPVHFFSGVWGMIAVGLFSSPSALMEAFDQDDHVGWFYSLGQGSLDGTLIGNQLLAIFLITGWVSFTMTPFFWLLNYLGWFRSESLDELAGLDFTYMERHNNNTNNNGDDDI